MSDQSNRRAVLRQLWEVRNRVVGALHALREGNPGLQWPPGNAEAIDRLCDQLDEQGVDLPLGVWELVRAAVPAPLTQLPLGEALVMAVEHAADRDVPPAPAVRDALVAYLPQMQIASQWVAWYSDGGDYGSIRASFTSETVASVACMVRPVMVDGLMMYEAIVQTPAVGLIVPGHERAPDPIRGIDSARAWADRRALELGWTLLGRVHVAAPEQDDAGSTPTARRGCETPGCDQEATAAVVLGLSETGMVESIWLCREHREANDAFEEIANEMSSRRRRTDERVRSRRHASWCAVDQCAERSTAQVVMSIGMDSDAAVHDVSLCERHRDAAMVGLILFIEGRISFRTRRAESVSEQSDEIADECVVDGCAQAVAQTGRMRYAGLEDSDEERQVLVCQSHALTSLRLTIGGRAVVLRERPRCRFQGCTRSGVDEVQRTDPESGETRPVWLCAVHIPEPWGHGSGVALARCQADGCARAAFYSYAMLRLDPEVVELDRTGVDERLSDRPEVELVNLCEPHAMLSMRTTLQVAGRAMEREQPSVPTRCCAVCGSTLQTQAWTMPGLGGPVELCGVHYARAREAQERSMGRPR